MFTLLSKSKSIPNSLETEYDFGFLLEFYSYSEEFIKNLMFIGFLLSSSLSMWLSSLPQDSMPCLVGMSTPLVPPLF